MGGLVERITELARESCLDLFASYGVDLDAIRDDVDLSGAPCGILGFNGDGLHGAIVLVASAELLAASCPVQGPGSRDWVGELANQLVGRLKNHLILYGVDISLGTPTILRGHEIRPIADTQSMSFRGPAGVARLTVQADMGFNLAARVQSTDPGLLEGEMLLF
jgi:hypothetical protein